MISACCCGDENGNKNENGNDEIKTLTKPTYVTKHIEGNLQNMGFKWLDENNSYAYRMHHEENGNCWMKRLYHDDTDDDIFVYVTRTGIGLDIDHVGGNWHCFVFEYKEYGSFIKTYDTMICHINNVISKLPN